MSRAKKLPKALLGRRLTQMNADKPKFVQSAFICVNLRPTRFWLFSAVLEAVRP
jgi:hypothetical protein